MEFQGYISLRNPNYVFEIIQNNNEWKAEFLWDGEGDEPLDERKKAILTLCAESCYEQGRFGNQLKNKWTVLDHCYALGTFIRLKYPDKLNYALQAFHHDLHEGVFVDMPRPFKTSEIKKIEIVVTNAMPSDWCWDQTISKTVKYWDVIASVVEAKLNSPGGWNWVSEGYKENPEDCKLYEEFMIQLCNELSPYIRYHLVTPEEFISEILTLEKQFDESSK